MSYLRFPPPLASVHLVIHTSGLALVGIVPLGCKDKVWSKFGVAEQLFDALDDISAVDLIGLPGDTNFFTKKLRLIRYLLINDLVQLARVLIREVQSFLELK